MMARRPDRGPGSFGAFPAPRFGGGSDRDRAAATRPGADHPRAAWAHPQERAGAVLGARTPPPEVSPGERYVERDPGADAGGEGLALRRGMRVTHERFGAGVVQSVDPGADPIATVKFSGWGTKRIKAAFLRFFDEP
jgi:DNA helicase-2/ATP-dependent DNA helicase PcrA